MASNEETQNIITITVDMKIVAKEDSIITEELYSRAIENIRQKRNSLNRYTEISQQILKDIETETNRLRRHITEERRRYNIPDPSTQPDSTSDIIESPESPDTTDSSDISDLSEISSDELNQENV